MRRTKEEAAQTRENLLTAALTLFGKRGVAATRLEDIAKEAGVSRGALYWHFDGKDAIIIELLKVRTNRFLAVLDDALRHEGAPLERLHRAMRALFMHQEKDEAFRDAVMLEFERTVLNDAADHFQTYLRQTTEHYMKVIADIIEQGKRDGSIRKDYATESVLQFLGSLTSGVFMEFRLQRTKRTVFPPIDRQAVAKLAIEALKA